MKLLIDEDTASASLVARLLAAGYEVVHLPTGMADEAVFRAAQRLAIPILTANVGRKGRHDPIGLYRLALENVPHPLSPQHSVLSPSSSPPLMFRILLL